MKLASVLFAVGVTTLAAPITGTLNFTGNAKVSTNTINFQCNLLGVCAGSNGDFFITGGSANTGTFASISILDRFGQVSDISGQPLDTTISVPDFATFAATSDVVLDLTKVFSGVGGACPPTGATTCTPPDSPLTLSVTPTGAVATFSVLANARRISTGETTSYKGLFTLQFTQSPSTVLAELTSSSVNTSYSVTFSPISSVPEPKTTVILGVGLALILVTRVKRVA